MFGKQCFSGITGWLQTLYVWRNGRWKRLIGTVSRGVRAPIIRQGDDLVQIVADSVLKAAESEGFELRDKDVVAVTEAVVARAQGNYATIEQIAKDVHDRVGDDTVGIISRFSAETVFPFA